MFVYLFYRKKQTKQKLKIMRELALKICQYNGQKGTEKQIEKCIKSFGGSIQLMEQFAKNRIK